MASVTLAAQPRTKTGSQATKSIRREGFIPGIVYGHGMTPVSLQIPAKALQQALSTKAGENVVINLNVEGVKLKESTCLVKDLQHDPVTDKIKHIDFTVISMTEKIDVKVHLVVKNAVEAPGIKEGGVLDIVHHEIEVECLPTDIPEKIEIDAKMMKIGDAVHAKDLVLPAGVVCKFDPEEVIVSLQQPMKEEVAAEETVVGEPEVIEKGKKVEGAEEGAAPAAAPAAAAKKPADKKE
jgi:large subunit ribosomal protein L25